MAAHSSSSSRQSTKPSGPSVGPSDADEAGVGATGAAAAADTRVCIKNVPPKLNEKELQAHLISDSKVPLIVTDIKILRRKDGMSRKVAFVGFQTPQEATHVVNRFDKTYLRTCRISVEFALTKEAAPKIHRPWSKHSVGSTKYNKIHGVSTSVSTSKAKGDENATKGNTTTEANARKDDFLAAMGVTTDKPKVWANDLAPASSQQQQQHHSVVEKKGKDVVSSDKNDDSDDDQSQVSSDDSGGVGGDALKKSSSSLKAPVGSVISDLDFLKTKKVNKQELESDDESDASSSTSGSSTSSSSSSDGSSSSSEDSSDMTESKNAQKPINKEADDKHVVGSKSEPGGTDEPSNNLNDHGNVAPTNRLFVRNIPFAATEKDVGGHFGEFGTIVECHIPIDDQKRNKGFCFVAFDNTDSAARAMDSLNGLDFQGRLIHVMPARKGLEDGPDDVQDLSTLTYKKRQEVLRKREAASTKGWSASFVRGDAVVDSLADRLGLKNGEILGVKDDLGSGNAAVRLALGETQIIQENRDFFRNHGVDLDVLVSGQAPETSSKRSNTNILVKNLPYDTTKEELEKLFGGHGTSDTLLRVLLSPSKTIALIEYSHVNDAKKAFKRLAYKRFKSVPLYLEWAPLASKLVVNEDAGKEKDQSTAPDEIMEVDGPEENSISCSIFVKNLNFKTTEAVLRELFEKRIPGAIRAVKIPVKAAPLRRDRPSESDATVLHSMGFGFVECDSEASAMKAIKAAQGILLDGHKLELKRSSKSISAKPAASKRASTAKPTKIMCRNVPFQATRKELLQLFGSFGHLKKVRLPKKFDGGHRGFAFVEYSSHDDAEKAMTALSRTHLYGRHLVLEWASDKDDMDTLRDKAKRDVDSSSGLSSAPSHQRPNKKIKF